MQDVDGLAHHLRSLHDLRQEHLAFAKELSDVLHALHQRSFNDGHGLLVESVQGFHEVGLQIVGNTFGQGVFYALVDGAVAPVGSGLRRAFLDFLCFFLDHGSQLREPFGGVGTAVQHDVLYTLQQVGGNVVVDLQHGRIDDGHVETGADGMVEEHRVHGLAHLVVAAEGKRQVAHAAAGLGLGQVLLDPTHGTYEVHGIVAMLVDARAHGEDVHVEDDVAGTEADAREQLVGALADGYLALVGGGLTVFVERHHHHGGTILLQLSCFPEEVGLTVFQADAVHDAFPLCVL